MAFRYHSNSKGRGSKVQGGANRRKRLQEESKWLSTGLLAPAFTLAALLKFASIARFGIHARTEGLCSSRPCPYRCAPRQGPGGCHHL